MNPALFNWSKIITQLTDETFGIPPDVVLQIVNNDQVHEIKAHKTILAMISPFFKAMFYSSSTDVGDKTSKVFKIEKTTAPAFQIVKDSIYNNKSIEDSLQGKSVDEVFHVVELIERFQINELMEAMKKYLVNFPITDDSVLEVAEEAMEFSGLFKAESDQLLLTCAQFLAPKLKDAKSMTRYAKENRDRGEVFSNLLALMDDIILTAQCPNCKKEVCKDGQVVEDDEYREGLLVTNHRSNGNWGNKDYGTGKILKIEATIVTLMAIKPGVSQNGVTGESFPARCAKSRRSYLFSCK